MSIDAELAGIKDRLSTLERRNQGAARKSQIRRLRQDSDSAGLRLDDVNAAVEAVDDGLDTINDKLDGMYVRFDSLDAKLAKIAEALHIEV